jgi:hypothetical protein
LSNVQRLPLAAGALIDYRGDIIDEIYIGGDEYKTEIYVWYGAVPGSNANVTFQGGKVVAKAQIGLA